MVAEGRPRHPGLRLQVHEPVLHRGEPAQIVFDVLLPHQSHRDLSSVRVADRDPEKSLAEEDPFGMVAQCAMPEVGQLASPILLRSLVRRA